MNKLRYIVLITASLVIAWMILGHAFWHPNSYLLMEGGDGYIIYFDAYFHVNHGSGVMLSAMNHPTPECIFMTDAQGLLSVALQYMSSFWPMLSDHISGVFHISIIIAIIGSSFFLYWILLRYGVHPWLAVVGAILIGACAPQLVRPSYGHFALSYPVLIPMAIWLLQRKINHQDSVIKTILAVAAFFLLGLNNAYLIFIVGILGLTYGIMELLYHRKISTSGILKIGVSIGLLLSIFLILHTLDPYDDRIASQWGHFYYASTLSGLFAGTHSLLYDIGAGFFSRWEYRGESLATISLTSLIILIGVIVSMIASIIRRQNPQIHLPSSLYILLLSSLVIFLYSSAMFHDKHWQMLLSRLEFLSMVKASGRLSWIPYYSLSITAIVMLSKMINHTRGKYVIGILILLWSYEGYRYINDHCTTNLYPNHLRHDKLESFIAPIASAVDLSNYQGIYNLPVSQSWNDNLLTTSNWTSEAWAYKIASATGIPLINSRISRAPVGRSLENIQLSSHPLIRKSILGRLNKHRPILFVKHQDYKSLTAGEQFIINTADTIYQDASVILYAASPAQLQSDDYKDALVSNCNSTSTPWFYYEGFDRATTSSCSFIGSGSTVDTEWNEIIRIQVPDSIQSSDYELSIWSYVNIAVHGMPFYNINVIDPGGQQIMDEYLDSRRGVDTQEGWIRTAQIVHLSAGYQIILRGQGRYKMNIDEVLLRPLDANPICITQGADILSINNYKL